jgi:DNA-binding IclR family transcriptional regulator
VRDASGVVAAASVSAQRSRLPDEAIPLVRDQLLEATNQISAALGHGLVLAGAGRNGH